VTLEALLDLIWPEGWLGWLVRLVFGAIVFTAITSAVTELSEELWIVGLVLIGIVVLVVAGGMLGFWSLDQI